MVFSYAQENSATTEDAVMYGSFLEYDNEGRVWLGDLPESDYSFNKSKVEVEPGTVEQYFGKLRCFDLAPFLKGSTKPMDVWFYRLNIMQLAW